MLCARLKRRLLQLANVNRRLAIVIIYSFYRRRHSLQAIRHLPVYGFPLLTLGFMLQIMPVRADVRGRVVWVLDGDTVEIYNGHQRQRVRLMGIDAPEKFQPFGQRSRRALGALISGKTVTAVGKKQDYYGRLLAIIRLNGRDINARQVATGMAWAYRFHNKAQNAGYALLEQQARRKRIGLWAGKQVIEPWRWRMLERQFGLVQWVHSSQ
ncbi:thermonuclease family protein [Izhakiella australiensis]|nr:thermonuclease family protein [Izhakiella australiensis]